MKLVTPVSHLFQDVTYSKMIESHSDSLEARERTATLNFANTTHYHIDFDLNLGLNEEEKDFLIEHVKHREEISTLTFQAARDCHKSKISDGMYLIASTIIELDEQVQNTKKSLKEIRNIVGSDRNIGIENNNYFPTGAYDICTSLEYLLTVLEETDLHLLLDTAHAKVTSVNKDCSFEIYVQNLLETGRCKQIHICEHSVVKKNGKLLARDSHEIPSFTTTAETIELCKKYEIPCITVEYYKDAQILTEYLKYLKSLTK